MAYLNHLLAVSETNLMHVLVQVTEATLRELFAPAGFVWEVTIPRKPDGL